MIRLTLTLHPALWLTANQRLHWSTRMRRTRMLRALAASEARITGAAGKRLGASTVTAVKAIIDGLVDARVWDDDDHTHIPSVAFTRDPNKAPKGMHTVTLIIQEQETAQ